jgi:hypothetical protein
MVMRGLSGESVALALGSFVVCFSHSSWDRDVWGDDVLFSSPLLGRDSEDPCMISFSLVLEILDRFGSASSGAWTARNVTNLVIGKGSSIDLRI